MELLKAQLAFDYLQGTTITRISLDEWSATVVFNESEILVEGQWILTGDDSNVIDRSIGLASRSGFELWRLVGLVVKQVHIAPDPPYDIRVEVTNSWVLTILADNDGYEDWTYRGPSGMIICNDTNLTVFGCS